MNRPINTDIENCIKATQLDKFLKIMGNLNQMFEEKELTEAYECLKPCNYMEYRV